MLASMCLERTLSSTVDRALRSSPAVLVSGPRQSGKTTLLRTRYGESHGYVSLENPDVRARAAAGSQNFPLLQGASQSLAGRLTRAFTSNLRVGSP